MNTILKRLGLGAVLWVIPYLAAIPLMPLTGNDSQAFHALMALIAGTLAAVLAGYYFLGVHGRYFREAWYLFLTWVLVNWFLDLCFLLQFTHQTVPQYFWQLGVAYLGLAAPILTIGYLLDRKAAH